MNRFYAIQTLVLLCLGASITPAELDKAEKVRFLLGQTSQEIWLSQAEFDQLHQASKVLQSIPTNTNDDPYVFTAFGKKTFETLHLLSCLSPHAYTTSQQTTRLFKHKKRFLKIKLALNDEQLTHQQQMSLIDISNERLIKLIKAADFLEMTQILQMTIRSFCLRAHHEQELSKLVISQGDKAFDLPCQVKDLIRTCLFDHMYLGYLVIAKTAYNLSSLHDNTFTDDGTVIAHVNANKVVYAKSDNAQLMTILTPHPRTIAFDHSGVICAIQHDLGNIALFNWKDRHCKHLLIPYPRAHQMTFCADNNAIIIAREDRAEIMCCKSGKIISTIKSPDTFSLCCVNKYGAYIGYNSKTKINSGLITNTHSGSTIAVDAEIRAISDDGALAVVSDGTDVSIFNCATQEYTPIAKQKIIGCKRIAHFSTDNSLLILDSKSDLTADAAPTNLYVFKVATANLCMIIQTNVVLIEPAIFSDGICIRINTGGSMPYVQTIMVPQAASLTLETLLAFYTLARRSAPITAGHLPELYASMPEAFTSFLHLSLMERLKLFIARLQTGNDVAGNHSFF